jgi:hypothetical protein
MKNQMLPILQQHLVPMTEPQLCLSMLRRLVSKLERTSRKERLEDYVRLFAREFDELTEDPAEDQEKFVIAPHDDEGAPRIDA